MNLPRNVARAFRLEGEAWFRHANPWSAWTRAATMPFLVLAIWSRVWLGWWSLAPIGVLIIWIYLNPLLFARPRSLHHWASRAVLGERLWTERRFPPGQRLHRILPRVLSIIAAGGTLALIVGLVRLDIVLTSAGMCVAYLAKFWFLDRMVWLYEDVAREAPDVAAWLEAGPAPPHDAHVSMKSPESAGES